MKPISSINPESEFIKRCLWRSVILSLAIGVTMIAFICSYSNYHGYLKSLGCGVLIAGASLSSGGVLGFLFGIPSISQLPTAKIKYNDNLVQISDWLTKIIVGVGLTQLYQIPHFVKKIGAEFQNCFGSNSWAANVSIAIIGYFFVLGFLMLYFWTKTDYSIILKYMDDDLNKQLREAQDKVEEEKRAKEQAEMDKKQMATNIAQRETNDIITNSEVASTTLDLQQMQDSSDQPLSDELEKLKMLVSRILPDKPVTSEVDIQKGRWGMKAENNGKIISATVTKNRWQSLFDVSIIVSNTDHSHLTEPVAIFVHDSYKLPNDVVYVKPNATQGVVQLSLLAYEAFTLGALFPDGTELELDLNQQPGYPQDFYWKDDK